MPSDKCNSIIANASTSLQPDTCLLTYRSIYIAFFMDLPVSSFVSHLSLLTEKGVDLVVVCDAWLPFIMKIAHIFHSGYFDCRSAFQTVLES